MIITLAPSTSRVTGETVASAYFTSRIEQAAFEEGREYRSYNVGTQSRTLAGLATRAWAYFSVLACVYLQIFSYKPVAIYLVCPSGKGVFPFSILVMALRLSGYPILCHHHGRRWLQKRNIFLDIFLFAPPIIHLTQCDLLADSLSKNYPNVIVNPMSNAAMIDQKDMHHPSCREHDSNGISLGYISNLTFEKGVDEAVRLISSLSLAGHNTHLHIAGAPQSPEVANFLKEMLDAQLPITLWGFVDPAKKAAFFDKIDVLIFPTRYALETEALVTLEALSYGRPVIAHDIGCIGRNLVNSGGISVAAEADFCTAAANQIALWQADPTQLHAASRSARARFGELQRESADQILVHIIEPLGLRNPV